MHFAWLTTRW